MICLEMITNGYNIVTMSRCCNKEFHKSCFREWDKNNHTCPHCRETTITPLRQKTLDDIMKLVSERFIDNNENVISVDTTIYMNGDTYTNHINNR